MYKEECHTEVENTCEKEFAVLEEAEVNGPTSPSSDGQLHTTPSSPVSQQPNRLKLYNSTSTPIGDFVTQKSGNQSSFSRPLESKE